MKGETLDTTISLLKRRLNFNTVDSGESLAERIRARKEREEFERVAREKAFDEGLIGPGGKVAEGVENVVLISLEEEKVNPQEGDYMQSGDNQEGEQRGMFDLNSEPLEAVSNCNMMSAREGPGEQPTGSRGLFPEGQDMSSVGGNQDSDPFNLGPIIDAISKGTKSRKRGQGALELHESTANGLKRRATQNTVIIWSEAEETSLEGSPKSP